MSELDTKESHDALMALAEWHDRQMGDLRVRIESLRRSTGGMMTGTGHLTAATYNQAIDDVLALLGAVQEQP
jgi:hypothetical protein